MGGSSSRLAETELWEREIMRVRLELQHNAGLFDRPQAYMAGVEDTLAAFRRLAADPEAIELEAS